MPLYETNRHACYCLEYHLVVVTKYRHPVLVGALRERLVEICHEVIEGHWGLEIKSIGGEKDHLHILFSSKPQVRLSDLVNNLKTVTSRLLRKEFKEELAHFYREPVFWSPSYFICCVADNSHDRVKAYIDAQRGD